MEDTDLLDDMRMLLKRFPRFDRIADEDLYALLSDYITKERPADFADYANKNWGEPANAKDDEGIRILGAVRIDQASKGQGKREYEDNDILKLAEPGAPKIGTYCLGWMFAGTQSFQESSLVLMLPGQCEDTFAGKRALPNLLQAIRDYRQRLAELAPFCVAPLSGAEEERLAALIDKKLAKPG